MDYLDAGGVSLWLAIFTQFKLWVLVKLLAQGAVATFGENGTLGAEAHSSLEGISWGTILGDSGVVSSNTSYRSIIVVKNFGGSEALNNAFRKKRCSAA